MDNNVEILALVEFNGREAFVLNRKLNLKYTKHDQITIVGTDGMFYKCYGYAPGSGNFKAFAGREFDLELTDGTVEHCNGQWWSELTPKALEVIGGPIEYVTACDVESLAKCYVFNSYHGTKSDIAELRSRYTGPIYEYLEYERMLKKTTKFHTTTSGKPEYREY